jgi:hypothetical protein
MDAGTYKIVFSSIAENNPSQIEPGEPAQAAAWVKQRIWMKGNDKGREAQDMPEMEAASKAADKAVALYNEGKFEEAKPFALAALKPFGF